MSLLVLSLAVLQIIGSGGVGRHNGAFLSGAAFFGSAGNGEATHQQGEGESELLELCEASFGVEAGDVQVQSLLGEVKEASDPGETTADSKGGSSESDLGPGQTLNDKFAVLGDFGVLQLDRDRKASAGSESSFEVLVAALENSGVVVEVLQSVPAVQSEEGEETDFQDESADAHCDL